MECNVLFGDCPECKCGESSVGMCNVYKGLWCFCPVHKTRWYVGNYLLSPYRMGDEKEWEENKRLLSECREVEPRVCERCARTHAPRWHTRFRGAVTRRLRRLADWLDGYRPPAPVTRDDLLPF